MYRLIARIVIFVAVLMLLGCSQNGAPTTPSQNTPTAPANQNTDLTGDTHPTANSSDQADQVLGNWYYYTDDQETLAWGTVLLTKDGWDIRIDYVAPKLQALRKSDTTRGAQAVVDLTWLKLINIGVTYLNPVPAPWPIPAFNAGDLMKYSVNIKNNLPWEIKDQTVVATQVDMFNNPLGPDAKDQWDNVDIPKTGISLKADWKVKPDLTEGIYYTRVRDSFKGPFGWFTFVIFDAKAGAYRVQNGGGPEFFDPIAKGVTTTPTVAVGENVHVQDNGSFDPDGGPIVKYEWDINNDGVFDKTGVFADFSYPAPGEYIINLKVTDDEGATGVLPKDQLIKVTVTAKPVPPVAIGKASKYAAFIGENITFDGSDSYDPDGGSIVLYEWDWNGDGVYDQTGKILDHSYAAPGTYHVQLKVTDDEVQTDTLDKPLDIVITENQLAPTACAIWSIDNGDFPVPCQQIKFDASCSTDPNQDIVKYEWDWTNDGVYDENTTDPVIYHSYDTSGTFHVQLRVTDSAGHTDILDVTLVVDVHNVLPTAVGNADKTNVYINDKVTFDGSGSHDNDCNGASIVKYEWDFDGNGTWDAEGVKPEHQYPSANDYSVQLRVTDNEGGTDMLDDPIVIHVTMQPVAPLAFAKANPNPAFVGQTIEFCDDGSYDPDGGAIVKYEWDWDNDGVFDTVGKCVNHSFDAADTYLVQFRVTDDEGQMGTLTDPLEIVVSVEQLAPTACAEWAVDGGGAAIPCALIDFDGSCSSDPNQDIVKYEWDYNNDGVWDATFSTPLASHSYDTSGTFHVQLRVTDSVGNTDMLDIPLNVQINNVLPTAAANADKTEVFVNDNIHFDGTASHDNDCNGSSIVKYEWDFNNDGVFDALGSAVNHAYSAPDTYHVQLRVTDNEGGTDTLDVALSILVKVIPVAPLAYAKADPNPATVCQIIQFCDNGSYDPDGGIIVKYEWDWNNDGTFDEVGQCVNHSFPTVGTFYVQFRVTDDEGQMGTLAAPLQVQTTNADPTAVAVPSKTVAITNELIGFDGSGSFDNDCSGTSIVKYEWQWDTALGFEVGNANTQHSYGLPGIYHVQLRVTDNEGGTDTLNTPLEITVTLPPCPTGMYSSYTDRGVSDGYSTFAYSVLPRVDVAYIENGPFTGQGIVQGGWNSLVTFNPNVDNNDPIDDSVFSVPTGGSGSKLLVTSLDAAPFGSAVGEVTSDKVNELKLIDTSAIFGSNVLYTHDFGDGAKIQAVDFNSNGDVWAVVKNVPTAGNIFLHYGHYVGAPVYYDNWSNKAIGGTVGIETDIFDIAINWTNNVLYLFDANTDKLGRVTSWSLANPSNPTLGVAATQLFSSAINYTYDEALGRAAFADIEIDHMSGENCHLVLYAELNGSSEIQKRDNTLAEIATYLSGQAWPSMAINPDSELINRDLMQPGPSKLAFWDGQSDW